MIYHDYEAMVMHYGNMMIIAIHDHVVITTVAVDDVMGYQSLLTMINVASST